MLCEVFGLCYVRFLVCVMCFFSLCYVLFSRVRHLTSLGAGPSGPLRALRARCGPSWPAAGASPPQGSAWLLVVARLPGWSWQPVCPATFLPASNPVVSSGQLESLEPTPDEFLLKQKNQSFFLMT